MQTAKTSLMREVGERLQERARQLGLTDAEVARRLGLAQGRYSNYVNGHREPDLATLARICRQLSITPNELLGFGSDGGSVEVARARIIALLDGMEPDRLELAASLIATLAAHQRAPRSQRTGSARSSVPIPRTRLQKTGAGRAAGSKKQTSTV